MKAINVKFSAEFKCFWSWYMAINIISILDIVHSTNLSKSVLTSSESVQTHTNLYRYFPNLNHLIPSQASHKHIWQAFLWSSLYISIWNTYNKQPFFLNTKKNNLQGSSCSIPQVFLCTMIATYVSVRHTYLCVTNLNSKMIMYINNSTIWQTTMNINFTQVWALGSVAIFCMLQNLQTITVTLNTQTIKTSLIHRDDTQFGSYKLTILK
jgi:hypothetical protein